MGHLIMSARKTNPTGSFSLSVLQHVLAGEEEEEEEDCGMARSFPRRGRWGRSQGAGMRLPVVFLKNCG